jgi:hypothetical protein
MPLVTEPDETPDDVPLPPVAEPLDPDKLPLVPDDAPLLV